MAHTVPTTQWDVEEDDYETVYTSRLDSSSYIIVSRRSGSVIWYYNDWVQEVFDDLDTAFARLAVPTVA